VPDLRQDREARPPTELWLQLRPRLTDVVLHHGRRHAVRVLVRQVGGTLVITAVFLVALCAFALWAVVLILDNTK